MAFLPRPASPKAALSDLRSYWRDGRRHHLAFLSLSAAATGGVILLFMGTFDGVAEYVPPEPQYVTQWDAKRSREAVLAQQKLDAPRELAEARAAKARAEERRRQFQRVADAMGVDTRPR